MVCLGGKEVARSQRPAFLGSVEGDVAVDLSRQARIGLVMFSTTADRYRRRPSRLLPSDLAVARHLRCRCRRARRSLRGVRNIDAVAEDVVIIDDDVADVYAMRNSMRLSCGTSSSALPWRAGFRRHIARHRRRARTRPTCHRRSSDDASTVHGLHFINKGLLKRLELGAASSRRPHRIDCTRRRPPPSTAFSRRSTCSPLKAYSAGEFRMAI